MVPSGAEVSVFTILHIITHNTLLVNKACPSMVMINIILDRSANLGRSYPHRVNVNIVDTLQMMCIKSFDHVTMVSQLCLIWSQCNLGCTYVIYL